MAFVIKTKKMELISPDIGGILVTIFFLAFITLWVVALVRIIKHEFPGQNEKLIWALLVIFLPFIGTIIYLFVGRPREMRN